MADRKDVVLAVLGSSSAISGFVLVFLGLTLTTIQAFDAETPRRVLRGYRVLASVTIAAFLVGIVTVGLCIVWLAGDQEAWLYGWSVALSLIALALLVALTGWVAVRFVWRS